MSLHWAQLHRYCHIIWRVFHDFSQCLSVSWCFTGGSCNTCKTLWCNRWTHIKHYEPLVKHHEKLLKHCETLLTLAKQCGDIGAGHGDIGAWRGDISALVEFPDISVCPHGKLESGSPWEVQQVLRIIYTISGSRKMALDLVRSAEKAG